MKISTQIISLTHISDELISCARKSLQTCFVFSNSIRKVISNLSPGIRFQCFSSFALLSEQKHFQRELALFAI